MKLINQAHAALYRQFFDRQARRRPPIKRPIALGPKSRVLVFTCAGIGDTLTDSVVFKALAETYPGIRCAAVVHHRRRTLVEHNPFVSEIFALRKGPLAFWRLHKELKKAGPWDAILHLRGNDPEPRCQSFLLDPGVTVSVPNMTHLSHLCGHQVEQPEWDETHGVEQTLRIARYVGAKTADPRLVYEVKSDEKKALEQSVERFGFGGKMRIVLQVGGGRRASWRDWPSEHWVELIRLIVEKYSSEKAVVILLGGRDLSAKASEIVSSYAAPIHAKNAATGLRARIVLPICNLTGKLSLSESAALLASANAVVSTDTGIMHLAFAVGARVVALIHCNNPKSRVGPYGYGDRHRVVQLPRLPGYRDPSDANMADIAPPLVFKNLQEILP